MNTTTSTLNMVRDIFTYTIIENINLRRLVPVLWAAITIAQIMSGRQGSLPFFAIIVKITEVFSKYADIQFC